MGIRHPSLVLGLATLLAGPPVCAGAETVTGDKGGDMVVDLIVLRPIGLASTVVGGALFVLGLPFTVPSGTVGESACQLVKRPAAYTFARPLGDLDGCQGTGCTPCRQDDRPGRD
ncbi:hypothetical protein EZJ19_02075 [Parasulfuritortus cantonensis]|uniref:Multidrug transporter n=1 Tax=Parasulfuritortus cantonensis TaxID=2528202 RepID=A0A4V2NWS9_9PROT|nr:hypothetical protein [Parasulfuritortus cantonensis]TCJ18522.1 hypothetical protein EZJ19_02075 [Parasulfuritortus cantonensis]